MWGKKCDGGGKLRSKVKVTVTKWVNWGDGVLQRIKWVNEGDGVLLRIQWVN